MLASSLLSSVTRPVFRSVGVCLPMALMLSGLLCGCGDAPASHDAQARAHSRELHTWREAARSGQLALRQTVVEQIMKEFIPVGTKRQEVLQLLGASDGPEVGNLAFCLGRSGQWIDDKYLHILLDGEGRVRSWFILTN